MWISSKEFARLHNISVRALQLRIKKLGMQKILHFSTCFFVYSYTNGIGRGGKVLQIWSKPFKSEIEAEAFIYNQRIEAIVKACKKENKHNIRAISKEADFIKTYMASGSISLKNAQSDECDNAEFSSAKHYKVKSSIESIHTHTIKTIDSAVDFSKEILKGDNKDVLLVLQAEHDLDYSFKKAQHGKNKVSESTLLDTNVADSVDFANNECNNELCFAQTRHDKKRVTGNNKITQHDFVESVLHDKMESNNNIAEKAQQNKVSSNNTHNKEIDIASIGLKMGGIVDYSIGACNHNEIATHSKNASNDRDKTCNDAIKDVSLVSQAEHSKAGILSNKNKGNELKPQDNKTIAQDSSGNLVAETPASGLCPHAIRNDSTKDKGKTSFDNKSAQHDNVLHHKESINTGTESSKAISNKVSESTLLDTNVADSVDFANNECNNELCSAQHDNVETEYSKAEIEHNEKEILNNDKDVSGLSPQYNKDNTQYSKESNIYQPLSKFDLSDRKSQLKALAKRQIVKEWEALKKKGASAKNYIALVNANINNVYTQKINKNDTYTIKLTENKLYAWQRAYKENGLDGLLDNRGIAKTNTSKIKQLGLESLVNHIIEAQRSRINVANVHDMLHLHLHHQGLHDYTEYKLKNSEYISYSVLDRYIKEWKARNKIKTTLIYKGEDSAVGNYKASLGKSNYDVTSINQVVEIDASPLDKIFDAQSLAEGLDIDISHIKSWQKRYVLISLVDTYSRVASFHISDSENSLGIARAVAKYILKYGKPKVIKGDNGKAFLSKYTKEVMQNLGIEYKNVRAYSGWLKPYVENTFRTVQDRVIAWGKGYIGHNVRERQAIEFFFSKKERRLKKGAKTNLKELDSFESMLSIIDKYATLSMNRYIDDLGCSPCEAYNAKANEAIAMNEYELVMKLSPSSIKGVNKKGIMHGGVWYGCIEAFNYDKVLARANINNTKELFIYDENGNFIEIAHCVDSTKGVSAEVAKRAEQITFKRIKAARKDVDNNRNVQQNNLDLFITKAEQDALKVKTPKTPSINNINVSAAIALSNARAMQKAVGDDILEQIENESTHTEQKKKDLSFFAAVTKLNKGGSNE